MTRKTIIISVLILVVGFVGMQILISLKADPPRKPLQPRPRIVEAQVVELRDVQAQISSYGRVTSAQPVVIISEVQGTLLPGTVRFQPSQSFRKGDLLLRVDDRQVVLDLNSAKSDLLSALASVLPEIRLDFPEEYQVWQDYFSQCDFDRVLPELPATDNQKIRLFLSRFNVYKLYYTVRDLEIMREKHYFYAPFDGSITSTDLRIGSSVRSGNRLGEIINLEDLEIEVPISTVDIPWIDEASVAKFISKEKSGHWAGQLERIGKSIDPRTQTVQTYFSLENGYQNGLYDGIFLNAAIPGRVIEDAMIAPRSAIWNEAYVYLIEAGRLVQKRVGIARRETDTVIIDSGLQNGDTLVVEVLQGVAPGMLAQPSLLEPQFEGAK